jgi:hypothetical protein
MATGSLHYSKLRVGVVQFFPKVKLFVSRDPVQEVHWNQIGQVQANLKRAKELTDRLIIPVNV